MADTLSEAIKKNSSPLGSTIIIPEDTGKHYIESLDAIERQNQNAEDSTLAENLSASWDAFTTMNGAVGIFDFIDTDFQFGAEDPEFVKTWNQDSLNQYMADAKLPFKYAPRIAEAKSMLGLEEITRGVHRDIEREKNIREHLGTTATTVSTVAGALIDADMLIPFSKVAKTESVIKALSKPMALETAWVTARSMTDEDYSTSDAVIDVAMVGAITGGLSVYQKQQLKSVQDLKGTTPDINNPTTKRAESSYEARIMGEVDETIPKEVKAAEDEIRASAERTEPEFRKALSDDADSFHVVKHESDISVKNVDEAASELKAIIKGLEVSDSPAAQRVLREVEGMVAEVKRVDAEYGRMLEHNLDIKTGKFVPTKITAKRNSDGSVQITRDGKAKGRKIPAAIAVSLLGAGVLQADDGGEFEMGSLGQYILLLVAAGFAGKKGIEAVREEGSIIRAAKSGIKNMQDARKAIASITNSASSRILSTEAMMMRTSLTETYSQFAKAGGKTKELADKFLVNVFDGTHKTAEVSKRAIARISEMTYRKDEHEAFDGWLKDNYPKVSKIRNPLQAAKLHREFRAKVTDQVEFGGSVDPHVIKASKSASAQFRSLTEQAAEAGVKGFKGILEKVSDNYVPRYWKNASIRGIMEGTATEAEKASNKEAIKNAIADMIFGGQKDKDRIKAEAEAEAWVEDILGQRVIEKNRQRNAMLGRIQQVLDSKGIKVDDEELASALSKESDKIGRAMYRKNLDLKAFKPFKVVVNGKMQEITLNDFFERDMASIMQRYSNEMAGQIALAKHGFNTTESARKYVDANIQDPILRDRMHSVIDMLVGEQLLHMGKTEQTFLEMATASTFIAKLPYVSFAMMSEIAKVATQKNGMKTALNALYEAVNGSGRYSAIRDEMTRATGLGTSMIRHESGFRGADEISNVYDTGEGAIHHYLRGAKDIASVWYGLLPLSDGLQRIAMVANAERLAQFFRDGTGISSRRMVQYGITEKSKELLGKRLKLEGNELQQLEIDTWTREEKEEFSNIIFRMNQAITQETTMGGTALYMHNSVVGKAASYLLTFPAEAFSNHGLRDLTSADFEAFNSMTSFMLGSYVGAKLRYAAQGEEVDDDTIMYRAIIGMPIFGALSTAEGVTDPVLLDVLQNITTLGKLSNYEKDFTDE